MSNNRPDAPLPQNLRDGPEAYHEDFEKLQDALERLYISGNISGRIRFAKEWPYVAKKVFEADLIKFDQDGGGDKKTLAALEDEAEKRRIETLYLFEDVKNKSIASGVLEKDFVSEAIDKLGASIARHVYSEDVIKRIKPDLKSAEEEAREEAQQGEARQEKAEPARGEALPSQTKPPAPSPETPSGPPARPLPPLEGDIEETQEKPDPLAPSTKDEKTVNNPNLSETAGSLSAQSRAAAQNPALIDEPPEENPAPQQLPSKPQAPSLARPKRLMEVAPVRNEPISYKDLVAASESADGEHKE